MTMALACASFVACGPGPETEAVIEAFSTVEGSTVYMQVSLTADQKQPMEKMGIIVKGMPDGYWVLVSTADWGLPLASLSTGEHRVSIETMPDFYGKKHRATQLFYQQEEPCAFVVFDASLTGRKIAPISSNLPKPGEPIRLLSCMGSHVSQITTGEITLVTPWFISSSAGALSRITAQVTGYVGHAPVQGDFLMDNSGKLIAVGATSTHDGKTAFSGVPVEELLPNALGGSMVKLEL
jgi:hypothetical protein